MGVRAVRTVADGWDGAAPGWRSNTGIVREWLREPTARMLHAARAWRPEPAGS
jgi:hypothetical protein